MSPAEIRIDEVFDRRYRLVRKLGTGGMATVYLAEDSELGRPVAIKMLDERHAQDEQFVERFRREAKSAAVLSHPNIVAVYDRGEADGTYYIAMEYLEGKTLKELLVSRGPTPIRVAIDYARQILAALDFAHRHGIVHRDIKPHNVVIGPDGRVKVMDFGIARSVSSQVTEAGSIIGTAQYLSPEQARGAPAGPAADIYSTGIVLYEMLTGSVPFSGDTPVEVAMKHLREVPEPPSAARPEIPASLDSIVLRALAKDSDARYGSAREMDADLARVAAGLSVSPATEEAATSVLKGAGIDTAVTRVATGKPPPPAYPPRRSRYYDYERPVRRRPIWPWLLAALLLAAAGVAGFYVYTKIEDQLSGASPISVPFVEGKLQRLAVKEIRDAGLKPQVRPRSNETVDVGRVFDQDPAAGTRVDKESVVILFVSSGKAKTTVPEVLGLSRDEAVAALTDAHLKVDVHEVYSEKEPGTVTAQVPAAGERLLEGETVRINVSRGIRQISVPSVVGQTVDEAITTLEGQGFAVGSPVFENSDKPENTVLSQDPAAGTLQRPGTTITLTASKGPAKVAVPDVEGVEVSFARATLRAAKFKVVVIQADTDNPDEDGIVIVQSPAGGTEAAPGDTVTLTVGNYVPPPTTETTTTETTTTETTPFP
jgi:eukaryotic-like serine/threonine-protein kinase